LGVAEGTIRQRIKRLQKDGLIQFTVVTDFRMAGSPNLCMMGIDADPSRVRAIAEQLKRIPEINCVVLLLGRFNILAMGLFTNIEQLDRVVKAKIRPLPGVQRVETAISVHNLKYEAGVAKIMQRAELRMLRGFQAARRRVRVKSVKCLSRLQDEAFVRRKATISGSSDFSCIAHEKAGRRACKLI
jgi:DNA-binding Lrp family transcriptional regulator